VNYARERGAVGREGHETWRRADGGGLAWIDARGKLRVEAGEIPRVRRPMPGSYEAAAALPDDPDALLRWVYEQARNTTGAAQDEQGDAYVIFIHTLRETVVRPELEAAIFRAMKRIPGVTVETVEVFGRPTLALGLDTSDWLHQERDRDRRRVWPAPLSGYGFQTPVAAVARA
jgi:hypothetical protein